MDLTTIFCEVDDFCKGYMQYAQLKLLPCYDRDERSGTRQMTLSEIIVALVCYGYGIHSKEFKTFKGFYKYTYSELKSGFPTLLSYGRIIELKEEVQIPFAMFLVSTFGECTGISYGDSTPMPACHIKREYSHKGSF